MRLHVGTYQEYIARRQPWRRWFAWHPVRAKGGTWVWLEWVERGEWSCDEYGGSWGYRLPVNETVQRTEGP